MSGRREELDDTPVEWPLGLSRPLTLQEEIARYMRVERAMFHAGERESMEDANDFDVGDDEGDLASGVDAIEMAADEKYDQALEEFDRGLAAHREAVKANENRSEQKDMVTPPEAPQKPAGGG